LILLAGVTNFLSHKSFFVKAWPKLVPLKSNGLAALSCDGWQQQRLAPNLPAGASG